MSGTYFRREETLVGIVLVALASFAKPLSLRFEIRQRGTPAWDDLEAFLSRESPSDFKPLRDAVEKYPRILYHTTAWQMTWVFVDENGIIRGYYLTSQ